ncbi:TPA: helix-turn-helix domain-containing protein [Streptococcus suis]|nr:helix-turn-helix domain-containing protein [Streptococcus suis]
MHIAHLLEKRENAILHLMLDLQRMGHALSLKEACRRLDVSRSTLLRYITTFNEDAGVDELGLEFSLEDENLTLKRSASLSSQELLGYLCRPSLRYQLLLCLLDRNDVSIPLLAQELLVSEATISRQLASLNKLLKEFQIGIKGGKLRGSELQIRYFYFNLLWLTQPASDFELDRVYQEQLAYLPIFERQYQSSFNPRQAHQLALWLTLVQKRMRLKDLDFQSTYERMKPYHQHKFYRQLRSLFLTMSQQKSSSFQEGDTMTIFAFLFSQGILAAHQLEQLLGFGGPIMEATSRSFQELKTSMQMELMMEEESLYQLNQLFSQLYFFQSWIETGFEECPSCPTALQDIAKQILISVQENWFLQVTKPISDQQFQAMVQLIVYLLQVERTKVRLALASSYSKVRNLPLFQYLQQELDGNGALQFEFFEEGKDYDLILCLDYPLTNSHTYQLFSYPHQHDILALKKIISSLHLQKLDRAKRLLEGEYYKIERR